MSEDIVKSCAISSNLESYPQLIDEMQALFGDAWGGLDIEDAISVLRSSHAENMESVIIAVGSADEEIIPQIVRIVETAKAGSLRTIVVTRDISATSLHAIMRSGADDFLPFPVPHGGLEKAVFSMGGNQNVQTPAPAPLQMQTAEVAEPVQQAPIAPPLEMSEPVQEVPMPSADVQPAAVPEPQPAAPLQPEPPVQTHNFAKASSSAPATSVPVETPQQPTAPAQPLSLDEPAPLAAPEPPEMPAAPTQSPTVATTRKSGTVFPVLGMAGGVGATTFGTNLAWEMQNVLGTSGRILVMDFGFQFGSVATYLDTPRTDATFELYNSIDLIDAEGFTQALSLYKDTLAILPAPPDAAPLELMSPTQVGSLIDMAASQFDYVFIDLPPALVNWSEVVLDKAHLMFALCELDMRSAQNALRFLRALKADDLPYEKVQFILNNAPKMTDLSGRSRIKRMADSLNIEFRWMLPDGGKHVLAACDQGEPLALTAARNPYRKEIRKIAENLIKLSNETDETPAQSEKGVIQVRA